MKIFSVLAFASLAWAQIDISIIPNCALLCFAQGAPAAGCQITDYVCQCTTGLDALTKYVSKCVADACSANDIFKTTNAAQTICAEAVPNSNSTTTSTSSGATTTANTGTLVSAGEMSLRPQKLAAGAGIVAAAAAALLI